MDNSSKELPANSNKKEVFIFVRKPTRPVFLRESFLDDEKTRALNQKGWMFTLNLVKNIKENRTAASIMIYDVDLVEKPTAQFYSISNTEEMNAVLAVPNNMFEPFESDVFTINGKYNDIEVGKLIEEWTIANSQTQN
jgi:hypothetical protein